jgi:F-type H+-transporting ATPase subunit epsilon
MAMTIHVDIVSAEAAIFSGVAEMVIAPAVQGEVGVMPLHAPFLTSLKEGAIRLRKNDKEESFYISGGMLEVQPHKVTVLSDTALRTKELDQAAALKAKEDAESILSDGKVSDYDHAAAQAELAKAMLELRAIEKLRKIKQ